MKLRKHQHIGCAELVFSALTQYMGPPPIEDNPPLHIFTMSIGIQMGRLLGEGKVRAQDVIEAANWVAGKKTPREIVELIWNVQTEEKKKG